MAEAPFLATFAKKKKRTKQRCMKMLTHYRLNFTAGLFLALAFCLTSFGEGGAMAVKAATNVVDDKTKAELAVLQHWEAGRPVSARSVERFGWDKCFVAEKIDERTFKRMEGRSFKSGCTTPRSDLRYLKVLHRTKDGRIQLGEMVCHKDISADLLDIFKRLYEARYPIERMVLIDNYNADDEASMAANNTSCFNFRRIGGSSKPSKHGLGKAVDINPLYNPYVKKKADGSIVVNPKSGKPYVNRSKAFDYKIVRGDLCHTLFIKHGFRWGGGWRSLKDYQHFEKP